MDLMLAGGLGQGVYGGTGDVDGAFEIAAEHAAAFRGASTDAGAEIKAFRIGGDESFGEYDQARALRGGAGGERPNFFERGFAVEDDGRGLHYGGFEGE